MNEGCGAIEFEEEVKVFVLFDKKQVRKERREENTNERCGATVAASINRWLFNGNLEPTMGCMGTLKEKRKRKKLSVHCVIVPGRTVRDFPQKLLIAIDDHSSFPFL